MLHGYFEKDAGGMLKALQDGVCLGNKAAGEDVKLRLDLFVLPNFPAAKDRFYFLHQEGFDESAKGAPSLLGME